MGSRRTIVAEKLFDENAEKLTKLAIELAEKGDFRALRLCMDRICARPQPFEARTTSSCEHLRVTVKSMSGDL